MSPKLDESTTTRHAFDSQNVSFWSVAEQQCICYFRTWTSPDRLRSIGRTTSEDFQAWTDPVAMNPNVTGEHLYTNQTQPFFRARHIDIALRTRYVRGRGDASNDDPTDDNATDILLMRSRAGSDHYDRTFAEAFIRPGLDPQRWKNRANYITRFNSENWEQCDRNIRRDKARWCGQLRRSKSTDRTNLAKIGSRNKKHLVIF